MEVYMLTLKVTVKQRFNGNMYDTNRTFDILLPNFLRNNINIDDYIFSIINSLFGITEKYVSLLYTDEGEKIVRESLKKGIVEFQKNSISTKAKCIYKWNDNISSLQVYIKRL